MPGLVDPVRCLVDRVGVMHPAPAHFAGFEMDEWDDGAEEALVSQGVFIATTRTRSAKCGGCEHQCSKAVVVRAKKSTGIPVAYIECDEEPGHGRVPVELEQLRRYRTSVYTLAQPFLKCLKLDAAYVTEVSDALRLGQINGRYGERDVVLLVRDRRVLLLVGEQEVQLATLMNLTRGKLVIDKKVIDRLSNRKLRRPRGQARVDAAARSPASKQSLLRAERNRQILQIGLRLRRAGQSWPEISEEIARKPFIASPGNGLKAIKAGTVRRILATLTGT